MNDNVDYYVVQTVWKDIASIWESDYAAFTKSQKENNIKYSIKANIN